ncbi:MAG: serine/threonine protein kinase [Phycisphaeraceae bacterium]|nr:serine/threonine protein kinase [Phycisphaeraceae bacterium]
MSTPVPPQPEDRQDDFATRSLRQDAATSGRTHDTSTHSRTTLGGRFAPGVVLADRYRVVSFLGKGGMGEVYRAEDLRLGQQVALKFLPPEASRSPAMRDRLHAEVRLARQVAHRHVCRVYDIGEAKLTYGPSDATALELSFLTMEYVDGEDLATLTRRIGRLPHDKALQIARQVCAGLAAAHDAGIIHRDLKPSNVMLDGRGEARLTDFGIAGLAEELASGGKAGTPLYMAPEQHAGAAASVRTDVYSLGLVLYELFTGKRAINARDEGTITDLKSREAIEAPSSLVRDIDPAVERVILRCLSPDPALRPASALAVAAALPGGDPLAAALAAGETPSPSMIAASGSGETMRPGRAAALALSALAMLTLFVFANTLTKRWGMMPTPRQPAVLEERARETLAIAGWPSNASHEATMFANSFGTIYRLLRDDLSRERRLEWQRRGSPPSVLFALRGSERFFHTIAYDFVPAGVTITNPPAYLPGDWVVILDTRGRLLWLDRVPARRTSHESSYPEIPDEPRFRELFAHAGLNIDAFEPIDPPLRPMFASDTARAWRGQYPDDPSIEVTVHASVTGGRVTHFSVMMPWATVAGDEQAGESATGRLLIVIGQWAWIILILTLITLILVGSIRNMQSQRADARGAIVLALATLAMTLLGFGLNMYGGPLDLARAPFRLLAATIFAAALVGLAYLAVEPAVRRAWPQSLVAWTRLLSGRVIDPEVGRSVLLGLLGGATACLAKQGANLVAVWHRGVAFDSDVADLNPWLGMKPALSLLFDTTSFAVSFAFINLVLLVMLRKWLKRAPLVFGAYALVWLLVFDQGSFRQVPWIGFATPVLTATIVYLLFTRAGVLAAIVCLLLVLLGPLSPVLPDLDAWHAGATVLLGLFVVALAAWGFAGAVKGGSSLKP